MLCDYLFHHTPAEAIEARTHVENVAEQKVSRRLLLSRPLTCGSGWSRTATNPRACRLTRSSGSSTAVGSSTKRGRLDGG
jgi:hypothetical protein